MFKIKDDEKVIENAPKNATHVDDENRYYRYINEDWFKYTEDGHGYYVMQVGNMGHMRSLSDIREKVTMMNMLGNISDFMDSDGLRTNGLAKELNTVKEYVEKCQ